MIQVLAYVAVTSRKRTLFCLYKGKYTLGHCRLARLHACVMRYRSWNTTHFGLAELNFAASAKISMQRSRRAVRMLGYLLMVCVLVG